MEEIGHFNVKFEIFNDFLVGFKDLIGIFKEIFSNL
jgi:hypothetical protein